MVKLLPLHVLVISYPAQGHVMPLMEICHKLVDQGVKVTFVNTESTHNKLIAGCLPPSTKEVGGESAAAGRQLLHLVSIPDALVRGECREASVMLEAMINKDCGDDAKVSCVISDVATWWALEVAEKLGLKGAMFSPTSIAVIAMYFHIPKLIESGIIDENGTTLKHDEMVQLSPSMHAINIKEFTWNCTEDPHMRKYVFKFAFIANKAIKIANFILGDSFYELEPGACDLVPKMLPIAPLIPNTNRVGQPVGHLWPEDSTCLTWLDQQPVNSVIYVAFGSTTIIKQEQFNEFVHGLDLAGRPFLWVIRPGLITEESTNTYPNGFEKKGKIVDWAPQQKVLAHPSIACFLTHCGWNSMLESLAAGVPFLCWPYFSDHFHNRTYICDVWKVGLKLNSDGENGIISRNEIKSKVEELIGDEGIKNRVLKMKEMTVKSLSEGGSSWKNFQTFIEALKH